MKTTKANFVENNVLDSSRFFCPALPNLCALFEKKHHLVNFVGFIAVFFGVHTLMRTWEETRDGRSQVKREIDFQKSFFFNLCISNGDIQLKRF